MSGNNTGKMTVAQLFGAQGPSTQAPALQPNQAPANSAVQNPNDTSSNLQQQQQQQMQQAPKGNQPVDESPLAPHVQLWENAKDDKGNDIVISQNPFEQPLFRPVDQKALRESLNGRNLVGEINADVMTKALQGDQASMAELLNSVAQGAVTQALAAVPNLVEGGVKAYHDRNSALVPDQVRQMSVTQHLAGLNKEYQNPAVRPVVEAAAKQFLQKNPSATPAQVAESVHNYMLGVAAVMGKKPGQPGDPALVAGQQQQSNENWGDFFGGGN
jgi:hypothetical protein